MKIRCKTICVCLLALSLCSVAPSADEQPDVNRERAVKALASLAKAYNARDAKAIAEQFTPIGEFVDGDGNVFQGHEAIAKEFAALFKINPEHEIELVADEIREISPGLLVIESSAHFAAGDDADPIDIDFAALLVRQTDGHWLLASIESKGAETVLPPHVRLKQLDWLIGDWVDESAESTMHTNTRWSDDGNFILTDFAVQVAGEKVMSGTQRIGWDESLQRPRSWVFDSEGGFAEGIWSEVDERWIVKSIGVRADGDVCSATQTYQQQGDDSFEFSATERIVGDEEQPDFTARVVRTAPEPDDAPADGSPTTVK